MILQPVDQRQHLAQRLRTRLHRQVILPRPALDLRNPISAVSQPHAISFAIRRQQTRVEQQQSVHAVCAAARGHAQEACRAVCHNVSSKGNRRQTTATAGTIGYFTGRWRTRKICKVHLALAVARARPEAAQANILRHHAV